MIKISDSELKVMKVVWNKKQVTSLEIIENLKDNKWKENTIRTFINRLFLKKAIGISKKVGKVYTYVPLIEENKYRIEISKKLIEQFFNNSVLEFIEVWQQNNKNLE